MPEKPEPKHAHSLEEIAEQEGIPQEFITQHTELLGDMVAGQDGSQGYHPRAVDRLRELYNKYKIGSYVPAVALIAPAHQSPPADAALKAPAAKSVPSLRKKNKQVLREPPPGPGLKEEVYTVVHDAGILMTRDQIVVDVLKRGNIKKFENIGSTIGFFLNSDSRYESVGIYYRLRAEKK